MKKLPKIYINKFSKLNNNKEIYYSYKDNKEKVIKNDIYQIQNKINELFKSNDFVYKHKFHIITNNEEKDYIIVSRSPNYLLSINGEKIYIENIVDIY